MKATKYNYLKVIQQNYGQGWEDVSEYVTNSQGLPREMTEQKWASGAYKPTKISLLVNDLKEYETLGYPTRVIRRKELKTT